MRRFCVCVCALGWLSVCFLAGSTSLPFASTTSTIGGPGCGGDRPLGGGGGGVCYVAGNRIEETFSGTGLFNATSSRWVSWLPRQSSASASGSDRNPAKTACGITLEPCPSG